MSDKRTNIEVHENIIEEILKTYKPEPQDGGNMNLKCDCDCTPAPRSRKVVILPPTPVSSISPVISPTAILGSRSPVSPGWPFAASVVTPTVRPIPTQLLRFEGAVEKEESGEQDGGDIDYHKKYLKYKKKYLDHKRKLRN